MGALLNQWKTAKQLFKTTAKVKKPSPKVGTFARKTLGIEKALIKLEALQAKGLGANPKTLTTWKSAALDFRVVKTNYLAVLDAAIRMEPAGVDREAYGKGIAILKAWANDGRVVSDDATLADVLRELKLFEKAVLGVRAWAK